MAERLHQHRVPDQAYSETFNFEGLTGFDHDSFEVRVFGKQLDDIPGPPKTLDRHFIAQTGDNDLAIFGLPGLFDGQQITIHDADIAHTHAADFEKVVRLLLKQAALKTIALFNVFLRENGTAGSNPPHQRQDGTLLRGWGL